MKRRWLVPEVVQASPQDCGPAVIKCLVEGFGIPISYGRLREACQTEVDGTSIDTIEEVTSQLGLEAQQFIVPADFVLARPDVALPALTVVARPGSVMNFLVLWRRHGTRVQVMDPSSGRRLVDEAEVVRELHRHAMVLPVAWWQEFSGSEQFLPALREKLELLGLPDASGWLRWAQTTIGWRPLAALDAGARLVGSLASARAIERGAEAERLLRGLVDEACAGPEEDPGPIPEHHWFVRPAGQDDDGELALQVRGVVVMRVQRPERPILAPAPGEELPASLAAAVHETPPQPARTLWQLARREGALTPTAVMLATLLAAAAVVLEALIFRGFFETNRLLSVWYQRLGMIGAVLAFSSFILLIEIPAVIGTLWLGRHLEIHLREAFLSKMPRLGDRYFRSRSTPEMATRSHLLHQIRTLPQMAQLVMRALAQILLTSLAIAWLVPSRGWLAIPCGLLVAAVSLVSHVPLLDRELRVRQHAIALRRLFLEALIGSRPLKAHSGERAFRREHESLLTEWVRASRRLVSATVCLEGGETLICHAIAVVLLAACLSEVNDVGYLLLLFYWALNLPALGAEIGGLMRQYPEVRNEVVHFLEPLGAPDEGDPFIQAEELPGQGGVDVQLEKVSVVISGHQLLADVDLHLERGAHVAVVGASGAGKTTLVGLLLGWHAPTSGRVLVHGAPLGPEIIAPLRRVTVWVDPAVQLWNRSVEDNLRYGHEPPAGVSFADVLSAADLIEVLQRLPDGLQSQLGENGGLVSSGEAQRVRFGRGLLRRDARLVILDEPFRGLERDKRRDFLTRARAWWSDATFIYVNHDVSQTIDFPRVLVMEEGRVVEDGRPEELSQTDSRYRALLEAEVQVRSEFWGDRGFRRIRVDDGAVREAETR
jgi:ATP-binding cassette subfamily B protein